MSHTVKHSKKLSAYLVLDAAGTEVARYKFNADDFHGSRRVAYRESLADAAVRDEADDAALVTALINGLDAVVSADTSDTDDAHQVAELGADAVHAVVEQRGRSLFGLVEMRRQRTVALFSWVGTAREWLNREAA